MLERVRYVTTRPNLDGTLRYYWQRKGYSLTRLPDDPTERYELQRALNERADRKDAIAELETADDDEGAYLKGTIGWVVARYKSGTDYKECAEGTKKYYKHYLAEIREIGPHIPFRKLGPTETQDLILSYSAVHEQRKAKAVLSNLFKVAIFSRCCDQNWALQIRVSENEARDVIWEPMEIEAWLKAADKHQHGAAMKIAFALLRYTAQRATDTLGMKRSRFDGARIALKQEKTDVLVWVPCHRELRAILEVSVGSVDRNHLIPHRRDGKMPYPTFSHWFAEIRTLAGIREELQPRDLRRTAMVRMAEAGATPQQVSAVSGHTIERTQNILETYLPRTYKMAQGAISAWEKADTKGAADPGAGLSAEQITELREKFGLSDQQIMLLQLTSGTPSKSNVGKPKNSNV